MWTRRPDLLLGCLQPFQQSFCSSTLLLPSALSGVDLGAEGVVNFVLILYLVSSCITQSGRVIFLFSAGILQGCPLSSLLCTLVSPSCFLHFAALVDRMHQGMTSICADDLEDCCVTYLTRGTSKLPLSLLACSQTLFLPAPSACSSRVGVHGPLDRSTWLERG